MVERLAEEALLKALGGCMSKDSIGVLCLVFVIVGYGVLYALMRYAMIDTNIGPITFVAWRYNCCMVLLALIYYMFYLFCPQDVSNRVFKWSECWMWGIASGIAFLIVSIAVQYGEITETAAQTSFIIGMYVVIVPVAEWMLSGFTQSFGWNTIVAIVLDIPGVFLVSGCAEADCLTNFQWGILYNVIAMLFVVVNVLVNHHGIAAVGSTPLVLISFGFCAVVGTILSLILEYSDWTPFSLDVMTNWWLILVCALIESVGGVCVVVALAFLSPSRASIVASIESTSGAIFGWLILGEVMVGLEYLGGALMLCAVFIEIWPCSAEEEKETQDTEMPSVPTERTALLGVEGR